MHYDEGASAESTQIVRPELTEFVSKLATCPTTELAQTLRTFKFWKNVQFGIRHFISILNRFDDILESIINKYKYDAVYTRPAPIEPDDEELVLLVLDFTYNLLEMVSERHAYRSMDRVYCFLNCTSLRVKRAALRITLTMSQYMSSAYAKPPSDIEEKILKMATGYPPPISEHTLAKKGKRNGKGLKSTHFKLVDWTDPSVQYPSAWKRLDYEYFNSSLVFKRKHKATDREVSVTPTKRPRSRSALNTQTPDLKPVVESKENMKNVYASEGMQRLVFSSEQVRELSFGKMYERAAELPQEYYYGYELTVAFAKAFTDDSVEALEIRETLLSIKCLAIGVACCDKSLAHLVLEEQPYIFHELAALIDPELKVSSELRNDVIHALMFVASKRDHAGEILKAFSGNVAHGLLFRCLKNILKAAKEGSCKDSDMFVPTFFMMVSYLIGLKSSLTLLLSAGLLNVLVEFLQLKSNDRRTRCGALELISRIIHISPNTLDAFISLNGFKHLIDQVGYEVTFALENPGFAGGAPREVLVSYNISMRQSKLIRKLLKFIYAIIDTDGSDRVRNLFDSPLLGSLNTVMQNPSVFGNETLASCLVIVLSIMHNEPTAYSILNEAGTVDVFISNFENFFGKSSDLLGCLPEVIGALCLSHDGLKKVLDADLITKYFQVFYDPILCKELLSKGYSVVLGNQFDETVRHYPDLKDTIVANVVNLAKNASKRAAEIAEPVSLEPSENGYFYQNKTEELELDLKIATKYASTRPTNSMAILNQAFSFLDRLFHTHARWKNVAMMVTPEEWISYLTIPNTSTDFRASESMASLNAILKLTNSDVNSYALDALLKALDKATSDLDSMLDDGILETLNNCDSVSSEKVVAQLGIVTNLLYSLGEVYASVSSLTNNRISPLINFFASRYDPINEDKGLLVLRKLFTLYKRVVSAEIDFLEKTPDVVLGATEFEPSALYIQLSWAFDVKPGRLDTAQFKNTIMLNGMFSSIKTSFIRLLGILLRPLMDKRQDRLSRDITKGSMKVAVVVAQCCGDLLSEPPRGDYYDIVHKLIVVNFITCVIYVKYRSACPAHTVLCTLLLQNGAFAELTKVCKWAFAQVPRLCKKQPKNVMNIDSSLESAAARLPYECLEVFSRIVQSTDMPEKSFFKSLMPGDEETEAPMNLFVSFWTQAVSMTIELVDDLTRESSGIFACINSEGEPLLSPDVIGSLIKIYNSVWCSFRLYGKADRGGQLLPLTWENAWPSKDKVQYMVNLNVKGVDRDTVWRYLEWYRNVLPLGPVVQSGSTAPIDIDAVVAACRRHEYVPQPLEPIDGTKTIGDVLEECNDLESEIFLRWCEMLKSYPSLVHKVHSAVKNAYQLVEHPLKRPLWKPVFLLFSKLDLGGEPSAPLVHFAGLLLNDEETMILRGVPQPDFPWEGECSGVFDEILKRFRRMGPDTVSKPWFPHAMFLFECMLAQSSIPENIPYGSQMLERNDLVNYYNNRDLTYYKLPKDLIDNFFKGIISVTSLSSFESALSVARVLVLYSRNQPYALNLLESPVLKTLLGCVREYSSAANMQALQTCLIIIMRQCTETAGFVRELVSYQLEETWWAKIKNSESRKPQSFEKLLRNSLPSIIRSQDAFTHVCSEDLILDVEELPQFSMDQVGPKVIYHGSTKEHEDAPRPESGPVSMLLNELMDVVAHNDIYSSTEEDTKTWDSEKQKSKSNSKVRQELLFKNGHCLYVCFLLQSLVELLFSYEHSKVEFLTFSKKRLFGVPLRPRSTALNFLIYQLIPTNSFSTVDDDLVFERKSVVSTLAKTCVLALVSSLPDYLTQEQPKIPTPYVTLTRKFTVDLIMKVMKDTSMSVHTANSRYGKIDDLLELSFGLINEHRDSLVPIQPKSAYKYDAYHVARIMLEKGFPDLVAGILANLDLNYPNSGSLTKDMMRIISRISSVIIKYQDEFDDQKNEGDDAEDDDIQDDELEDDEETPNLLKNSTLGMYDIEENSDDEEMDFSDSSSIVNVVYSGSDGEIEIDDEEMISGSEIEIIEESDDSSDDGGDSDSSESEYGDHHDRFTIDLFSDFDSNDSHEDYERSDDEDLVIDIREYEDEADEEELDDDEELDDFGREEMHNHESRRTSRHRGRDNVDEGDDDDSSIYEREFEEYERDIEGVRGYVGEHRSGHADNLHVRHSGDFHRHVIDLNSIIDDRLRLPPLVSSSLFSRSHNQRDLDSVHLRNPFDDPDAEDVVSRPHDVLHFPMLDRGRGGVFTSNIREVPDLHIMGLLRAIGERNSGGAHQSGDIHNLTIRSTLHRWTEVAEMFGSTFASNMCRVLERNISILIYDKSVKFHDDKLKEEELKKEERERQRLLELKKAEEERAANEESADITSDAPLVEREPVYVMIGDRQVDISGTDIDPEFFEALPDDMREEVFTQHVRERRAEASATGREIPEIDPSFLSALPDELRQEILAQESLASRFAALEGGDGDDDEGDGNGEDDYDGWDEDEDDDEDEDEVTRRKSRKVAAPLLLDRFGIASLLRILFVPQSYYDRENFLKGLAYLCYNKQSKTEIVGLLLYILQEATTNMQSAKKIFTTLTGRAKVNTARIQLSPTKLETPRTPKKMESDDAAEHFPVGCTPLVVACQTVDAIQYLLEFGTAGKTFFLSEMETSLMSKRAKNRHLKSVSRSEASKYPINVLLGLLDSRMVKQEADLIDTLVRTLQVATRPLQVAKTKAEGGKVDLKFLPIIPDKNLRNVTSILVADECHSGVFHQTVATLQNLSVLENARKVFPQELSSWATSLAKSLVSELNVLLQDISAVGEDDEIESATLSNFMLSSSDQAKFLRVLTALDYLFDSHSEVEELKNWYKSSSLGPLWGALSDVLKILRDKPALSHIATVMSPLIEALLVVCKHSKVNDMPIRDVLKYEEKQRDFVHEPLESLFFSFTDEHKKILNQMVRANPKLMNGPFSMLVRNSKVLDFDSKRLYFEGKLHQKTDDRQPLLVTVRRDQVFLDSYRSLFYRPSEELKNSKLDISFRGEAGVDAGGVTREWFQVLSRHMFNPDYALFTPVASDSTTFHPNRTSYANPEHLSFFKFIGKIMGKALYDGFLLDCHFSRAVYKRILGRPLALKDIESLDLSYYKSLLWMLENDITDVIDETFSVESDDFGEHKVIDLIPDGRNVPVTEENKKEYVKLIVEYRLNTSVQQQMDSFLEGFHEIIPKELVSIFDDQELELLISGLPDIDVDDWRNNTVYQNYTASSPQIQWFWRAVKSFDVEERAKLLQFATGTSKVPLHGFKELSGVSGISKFSIHKDYGSADRLPSSHTCFNQIDLPEYQSYEALRGSLLLAITEGHEGFGLA